VAAAGVGDEPVDQVLLGVRETGLAVDRRRVGPVEDRADRRLAVRVDPQGLEPVVRVRERRRLAVDARAVRERPE
jgi:hypothetical protein